MASRDALEIERKYDVTEATPLPDLHTLSGVRRVDQPVEHALEAVYFDTDDLALAANHITLRRRTGGDDAGWHLKLPQSSDTRRELHEPLGVDRHRVPEVLLRRVRVHLRGRALAPVVRLSTRRIVRGLRGDGDQVLAVFCDDHVTAERLVPTTAAESWREWEVELVDGGATVLDAAESLFAAAGIRRSPSASKLARSLGDRLPPQRAVPQWTTNRKTAAHVLLSYLDEHVHALVAQDPLVREGGPGAVDQTDAVHDVRIAIRRLRSALATYRLLLDPDVAARLRAELQWLGAALGTSRDIQVINARLDTLVGDEAPALVLGPVRGRIDAQLGGDFATARNGGLEALDSTRYFDLLDALDGLLASPPLTDLAGRSAERVIPRLIERESRRLRRAVRAEHTVKDARGHALALHDVRKAAKRLRYAAELARPVRRRAADRLAAAAENLQTILGEHQDSVVARDTLLRLSTQAYLQGENGFSYGRLHAIEEQRAAAAEAQFHKAWKRFPKGLAKD
ncbi:CHAD domain-containing protein [Lacisediminihabitans sp.]|uniref:CYTH and CHAD domain-containing protein n=1 Tax=Lacisediminihabitans sp. TaxID=2787631 RepID=UPI00374D7A76